MNVKDAEDGEKGQSARALITWNRLSLFNVDQETCCFLRMCVFETLRSFRPLKTLPVGLRSQRPPVFSWRHHSDIWDQEDDERCGICPAQTPKVPW